MLGNFFGQAVANQHRIKDNESKHKKKLQEIENKYQQQVVEEVERYQLLLKSKEDLQVQYQQVGMDLQVFLVTCI
jgi:hypothetical protein